MPQDGVIRVEDLLRSTALQLRLIAGGSGTSRRLAWAHVSELEDPTPWLSGAVRWLAAGNLSTREIFARLERLSGYRLYACTTQRGPLLDGSLFRRRTRQSSYQARRPARRRCRAGTSCRSPGRGAQSATSWPWRPPTPLRPACRWSSTSPPLPLSSCRCRPTSGRRSAVKARKHWRRCSGACWTRPWSPGGSLCTASQPAPGCSWRSCGRKARALTATPLSKRSPTAGSRSSSCGKRRNCMC